MCGHGTAGHDTVSGVFQLKIECVEKLELLMKSTIE